MMSQRGAAEPHDDPGLNSERQASPAIPGKDGSPPEPAPGSEVNSSGDAAANRVRVFIEAPPGVVVRVTVEATPGTAPRPNLPAPERSAANPAIISPPSWRARLSPSTWPTRAAALAGALRRPDWRNWLARLRAPLPEPSSTSASGSLWRTALDVRDHPLTMALFGVAFGVYAIMRFVGLESFPIYFFTDEAVQTLQAASFVAHGFHDTYGRLFPTYFQNGASYNLSLSVYAQVLPYLLFGKSIVVTRGTPALLTLLGSAAASLALRNVFKARWWWLGMLLLAVTPAWFLHSRTAFETAIMVACYAWFLYLYLLYRCVDPRFLYPALFFGALAFYAYNGGQLPVVLTGLLLLISDIRYHWANRRVALLGAAFLVLLVLPYLRFLIQQPAENADHLRTLASYWMDSSLSLGQKVGMFLSEYRFGLSPGYWFSPDNQRDLARHIMKGYGHLPLFLLPFLALGLGLCLWRIRQPAYRTLLIALVVAPAGGAMTAVGITRVLVLVVPAALIGAVGVEALVERFPRLRAAWVGVAVCALLSLFGLSMLRDALVNGPVWYSDYELGGMQWGARQLFGEAIPAWLARDPQLQVYVSPTWANGTDLLPQFFLSDQQQARVQLQGMAYYTTHKRILPDDLLVVLPPEEYQQMSANPKFTNVQVEQILPYPNGQPGFYFVRLAYSPQADAIFEAEHEALIRPVVETFVIDGQTVTVSHSRFGAGQLKDMLDGDAFTLVNAPGSNPFVADFSFPAARPMSGLTLITGSMPDFTVTVSLFADANAAPQVYTQRYQGLPPDPTMKIDFSAGPPQVVRLRLEIHDNQNTSDSVNIHVREVEFR